MISMRAMTERRLTTGPTARMANDTILVVPSCDKFSDTWAPQFDLFFRFWPDCPFTVFLISNELTFDHERVVTLRAGPDKDWSTTIARALDQVQCRRILFWIDDAFLKAPVDTKEVLAVLDIATAARANFVRLRPDPKPAVWLSSGFGLLAKGAVYRVSLFATLWDTEVLKQIVRPGETAWEFELNGSERANDLDGFYCTKKSPFIYEHGIERGIWLRQAVAFLRSQGYDIDNQRRPTMTRVMHLALLYRKSKSLILHMAPERTRPWLLKAKRGIISVLRSLTNKSESVGPRPL